jgi:hypothetical protein
VVAWLRVDHGGTAGVKTWALHGPRPELIGEEPARRATLVLGSWRHLGDILETGVPDRRPARLSRASVRQPT